jgi:hypothetical protein
MLLAIDWLRLAAASLLLLPPMGLLHGRRVEHRLAARDWDGYWQRAFFLPAHAVDFLRAAAGAALLAGALLHVPHAAGLAKYAPWVAQALLLMLALSLQSLICREPEASHAPFAFAIGLVAGFLPAQMTGLTALAIAGLALIFAVVTAAGLRSPGAFFPLLALALPALGSAVLDKGRILSLLALSCALVLPWLLPLLFPRDLVVAHRASPGNPLPPPR